MADSFVESVLLLSLGLFAVTHIDTLLVISAFCADNDYRGWEVLVGHYVGFSIGLCGAVVGALVAAELFREWTFLLGLIPFSMGVWGLLRRPPENVLEELPTVPNAVGRIGVVTVTGIGLSGENIAVFVPFFAELSTVALLSVVGVYLVCAGVVFLLASLIVRYATGDRISDRLDRWLVPTVLMGIGGYVFATGLLVG